MEVILIRHGEADSNVNLEKRNVGDYAELTEKGRAEVKAIVKTLGGLLLDSTTSFFSSPYPRTLQTATILAEALGRKVITDERLQEIQKGVLEGQPVERAIEEEAKIDPDRRHLHRFEGGENQPDVAHRVVSLINEQKGMGSQQIVGVSHNHPILCGVGYMLGRPTELWEDWDVGHASITIIDDSDGEWRLRRTIPTPELS